MTARRLASIPIGSWPPRMSADLAAGYCGEKHVEDFLERVGTAMTKPKTGENTIAVKAQKTGNTVWIPIHFAYRKWIDRVPSNDSVMLHAGARALSYKSPDGFRTEWQKMMAKEEFKRFRENRIVFHGLRKNAVINLLEVGCTENQVGSICNMSAQMVQHYGREVALRSLAKDAMKLMEARWSEIEPAAFRNRNGT